MADIIGLTEFVKTQKGITKIHIRKTINLCARVRNMEA